MMAHRVFDGVATSDPPRTGHWAQNVRTGCGITRLRGLHLVALLLLLGQFIRMIGHRLDP